MRRLEYEPLVGLLEAKLDLLGVDGILCDADDTLFRTTPYIVEKRKQFSFWAASKVKRDPDEVTQLFHEICRRTYERFYVSIKRWKLSVAILGQELAGDEMAFIEGLPMVLSIFTEAPEIFDGVEQTLALLKVTGRKIGVVTHGPKYPEGRDWTTIKLEDRNLTPYIDAVWLADDTRPKGEVDWQGGADLLAIPNERLMIFGDGIEPDIIPALRLGMRVMAIRPIWDKHKGILPEGVPLLESFAEAPEAILAL